MATNETAPLLLDAAELARLLSISKSTLFDWRRQGRLGPQPLKIGRVTRWRADEITAWVNAGLPSAVQWGARRTGGRI